MAAIGDPFLWSALVALFLGLSLGQAARWLATHRGLRERRAGRSARAAAFLALAVLSGTALLVFPAKAGLSDPVLPPWSGAVLALGLLAGVWPRAAGLPLAALALGAYIWLDLGLGGWVAFRGPGPVASLLPYETSSAGGAPSFRGELELEVRDSVPVAQEVALPAASVAFAVETLELSGPARLFGRLARPDAPSGRLYRMVALAAPGAEPLRFPEASPLLGPLAPLGHAEGLEPGAPPVEASALLGFLSRRRGTSACAAVLALQPLRLELGDSMEPRIVSDRR